MTESRLYQDFSKEQINKMVADDHEKREARLQQRVEEIVAERDASRQQRQEPSVGRGVAQIVAGGAAGIGGLATVFAMPANPFGWMLGAGLGQVAHMSIKEGVREIREARAVTQPSAPGSSL